MIREWLAHPLTRGLSIDAAETTSLRRRIVRSKPFLKKLYCEWYSLLLKSVPTMDGKILELGSGAGFLKDLAPEVITSEVFECAGVDRVIDACECLPFSDCELKAILMTDVFHHLPNVESFFREGMRVVAPGGVISMIEPWVTPWSRIIYTKLHHEPFNPRAQQWTFSSSGPLSDANGALPWMVFSRDRKRFEEGYPQWKVSSIHPLMPIAYLLSGGVSMRALAPGWSYRAVRAVENSLGCLNNHVAMFAQITLVRVDA